MCGVIVVCLCMLICLCIFICCVYLCLLLCLLSDFVGMCVILSFDLMIQSYLFGVAKCNLLLVCVFVLSGEAWVLDDDV